MEASRINIGITGELFFNPSEQKLFRGSRIHLLEKIEELGSINKAAKAVGLRYTTAWTTVKLINNMAEQPLVNRLVGGKGGGGTNLTPAGKKIVTKFRIIQEEQQNFMIRLENRFAEEV